MEREKIVNAIQAATKNGKLTCEEAHALAARLDIPLKEIGALCDQLKIRISACQLGCF